MSFYLRDELTGSAFAAGVSSFGGAAAAFLAFAAAILAATAAAARFFASSLSSIEMTAKRLEAEERAAMDNEATLGGVVKPAAQPMSANTKPHFIMATRGVVPVRERGTAESSCRRSHPSEKYRT